MAALAASADSVVWRAALLSARAAAAAAGAAIGCTRPGPRTGIPPRRPPPGAFFFVLFALCAPRPVGLFCGAGLPRPDARALLPLAFVIEPLAPADRAAPAFARLSDFDLGANDSRGAS